MVNKINETSYIHSIKERLLNTKIINENIKLALLKYFVKLTIGTFPCLINRLKAMVCNKMHIAIICIVLLKTFKP